MKWRIHYLWMWLRGYRRHPLGFWLKRGYEIEKLVIEWEDTPVAEGAYLPAGFTRPGNPLARGLTDEPLYPRRDRFR